MTLPIDRLDALLACLKELKRERNACESLSFKSGDLYGGYSDKQRRMFADKARDAAIQIKRLTHEAHCLSVEMGIADLRDESQYTPITAPAGFGREFVIERRRPRLPSTAHKELTP